MITGMVPLSGTSPLRRRRVSWLAIPDYSTGLVGARLAVAQACKETAGQVNPQAESREIHCRIR